MTALTPIPPILEHDMTPLVKALITRNEEYAGMILTLGEQVKLLKDEIAVLKGQKPRPKIPPNLLDKDKSGASDKDSEGKRPGSAKRNKTATLKVDETRQILLENIPPGAKFKEWSDYVVQELTITKKVILFQLACFVDASGKTIQAQLPPEYRTGHFGPQFIAFCLYQYHQCHVTQPLLLEAIREFGVDISAGQLNIILVENKDTYHAEKEDILEPGLQGSEYFNTDDTGARHNGKNGYCTHIGGLFFSYFKSTQSKSRINFLEVLRGKYTDYVISDECFDYLFDHGASDNLLNILEAAPRKYFSNFMKWIKYLSRLGITSERDQRLATEGALVGSLFSHGFHDYPHIPLHNNDSERDIREYVKRRKISGSTRSAAGRRARDTFTSLKKTCRKLKISFWQFLQDRVSGIGKIPTLATIIRERSRRVSYS